MDLHPEHRIAAGVRGWLESPGPDGPASDCLNVSGWAFVHSSTIAGVWATASGVRTPLRAALRRDDVARTYPDEPAATHSGFAGYLQFEQAPRERIQLEIWASLSDGRSIRLFKRRVPTAAAGHQSLLRSAVQQVAQRPLTLLSGRSWLNAARRLMGTGSPGASPDVRLPAGKAAFRAAAREQLATFLQGESRLAFTAAATPAVSVVVVVWNQAELSLTCFRALAEQTEVPTEVIIVDNASTDGTSDLLGRLDGVTIIRNTSNLGFTMGLNVGARAARGEFLLLLNNDAAPVPGSIARLLAAARRSRSIGAVGGKLVYPDGRLQEAGSIVWSDGSCEGYGRGADPAAPEYNFERPVDFCSAALLITPRGLFERLGGFDERYCPAYYEDADYCVRVWQAGHSVVYEPKAAAIHYEFGSHAPGMAAELQRARRPTFVAGHAPWLASQSSVGDSVLKARSHPHGRPSVLVIDDTVPDPRKGAGSPRAAVILRTLDALGYQTTLFATSEPASAPPHEAFPAIEVVGGGPPGLRPFLAKRHDHQAVIVSRPHNMQYVKAVVGSDLSALGVPCVYDAEAIFALREVGRRRLIGQPMPEADRRRLVDDEIGLARGCAAVLAVSEEERQLFTAAGVQNVSVLSHAVDPRPTPAPFERRRTILFVGAFGSDSPNEDAISFFCHDVLPALRTVARCDAPVVVAGADIPDRLKAFDDRTVTWHSDVDDLTPLYDEARVFVAPTRYSAGISWKVTEAAARGVPIVCSPLVSRQLGWVSGEELLTAEDPVELAHAIGWLHTNPEMWLRLREAALKRVAREHSFPGFRSTLQRVLDVDVRT
jgi:GT2 family glycosyltransferase